MVGKHGRGKPASECDDLEAVGTHGRGKPCHYHDTTASACQGVSW